MVTKKEKRLREVMLREREDVQVIYTKWNLLKLLYFGIFFFFYLFFLPRKASIFGFNICLFGTSTFIELHGLLLGWFLLGWRILPKNMEL